MAIGVDDWLRNPRFPADDDARFGFILTGIGMKSFGTPEAVVRSEQIAGRLPHGLPWFKIPHGERPRLLKAMLEQAGADREEIVGVMRRLWPYGAGGIDWRYL